MNRALLSLLPASLAFSGCAGSLSGEVDGKSVPAIASAYFIEGPIGDQNAVMVTLSTASDACEGARAYHEEAQAAIEEHGMAMGTATSPEEAEAAAKAYYEEMARIERAHRPQEYWSASLVLSSSDVEALVGEELESTPETPFGFTLTHVEGYAYPETVEPGETPAPDSNATGYLSTKTTLTLDSYQSEGAISGSGTAKLAAIGSGDEAGEVTFSFHATWCDLEL